MNERITQNDVMRYLACPHWLYWERFGDPSMRRELSTEEEAEQQGVLSIEARIVKELYPDAEMIEVEDLLSKEAQTRECMEQGAMTIYGGILRSDAMEVAPTVLERKPGRSVFGDWFYQPILIRRAHVLRKEHKLALGMCAMALESVQGTFPAETAVMNRDHERLLVDASLFIREIDQLMETIRRIMQGECPNPVYRKACADVSPWGDACFSLTASRNDAALLFGIDRKHLQALRTCGIRTVEDAAAMDPASVESCTTELTPKSLASIKRQARALQEPCVIVREAFADLLAGEAIYFDIESQPATDTDYLFGFLFRDAYFAFSAKTMEQEEAMWRVFLAWLQTLPLEYTVYHYGDYEIERLHVLASRYATADDPWLKIFRERMVDLKESVRDHVVLPLYVYSLKSICGLLGFVWRGEIKNGRASVHAFDEWLRTQDEVIWRSLLTYNEDDVRATKYLADWLRTYAGTVGEYPEPYPWQSGFAMQEKS